MNVTSKPQVSIDNLLFNFVTPVWGSAYTRLFLEVALPSFLSPGNLPAVTQTAHSAFQIYTTPVDAVAVEKSSAIAALRNLMSVDVHLIDDTIADKYVRMSFCHKQAIREADERNAALVFMAPDAVFSDGSIGTLARLAREGKRVVFGIGLRLYLEKAVPALSEFLVPETGAIRVPSRRLMEIALDNLHPITLKHIWGDGPGEMIPNNLFWRVNGEGLLGRCFHALPIMVNPRNKHAHFISTIDDDYVLSACPDPADWYVVTDSDEILICELSTIGQQIPGFRRGSVSDLISFAELFADSSHRMAARKTIYLHTGRRTPEKWAAAQQESDRILEQTFRALERNSVDLLFSDPVVLLRRLRRLAHEREAARLTGRTVGVTMGRFDRIAVGLVGKALNLAFNMYVGFSRWYLPPRDRVVSFVFGSLPNVHFWNRHWLRYRCLGHLSRSIEMGHETGESLFVTSSAQKMWQASKAAKIFLFPEENEFEWPFESDQFAAVLVAFGGHDRAQISYVLREACRVLKPGARLAVSGLPAEWSEHDVLAALPTALTITSSLRQGGLGSRYGLRFLQAFSLRRRPPARLALEAITAPVLLFGGILLFGITNALARLGDLFGSGDDPSVSLAIVARKDSRSSYSVSTED